MIKFRRQLSIKLLMPPFWVQLEKSLSGTLEPQDRDIDLAGFKTLVPTVHQDGLVVGTVVGQLLHPLIDVCLFPMLVHILLAEKFDHDVKLDHRVSGFTGLEGVHCLLEGPEHICKSNWQCDCEVEVSLKTF